MALRSATPILILAASVVFGCGGDTKPDTTTTSGQDSSSPGNRAPTISGSPDTAVQTGDVYSFVPSASDPDGDQLAFAIDNLPRWASFDTLSGRLSGQPSLGDEGLYERVQISVTDGSATASTPEFSIEVTQTALGSMTLSWTPPTQNTDGTALTDLAGYNLYYGESAGNYPNRIRIDNPSISTYMIENLLPDTYYVVATSFNTSEVESAYSNMAIKTVQTP